MTIRFLPEAHPAHKRRHGPTYHEFSSADVASIRADLLKWYDESQRILPWREPSVCNPSIHQ